MNDIIYNLNRAIDSEYDNKINDLDQQLALNLEERILKGVTIKNVTIEVIEPRAYWHNLQVVDGNLRFKIHPDLVEFEKTRIFLESNISKFSASSQVTLHNSEYSFDLVVEEDNGSSMILKTTWRPFTINKNLISSSGWQLDEAKVDLRKVVKKSTDILFSDTQKAIFISNLLSGNILPAFNKERIVKAEKLLEGTTLNETQKQAFTRAYSTENYFTIQGPPGTGKTLLLAHLAVEFAKEGNKVLITANTHTAINNALQKCSVISGYTDIIKVGEQYNAANLNYGGSTARNFVEFSKSKHNNESKGIIVGATCYSPLTRRLNFMDWDVIIIDEAGQLTVPLAVAAMVKGEKFIFIGDHKQLPPIFSGNAPNPIFPVSIFEHTFQHAPGIMLDITYRMSKEINQFPSKTFYNGELHPDASNENWRLEIPNNFSKHSEILDKDTPEILYCHFHQSNYSISEYEANLIAEFVEEYLAQGIKPDDIAVITPFRQQVRQLNKALSKLTDYKTFKQKLFVDTVERIQGQERDVVIYSLVVSDPEKALHRPDFFFSPNRFNVALTRAKKKRIVVANKALFELSSQDPKIDKMIANFRDFYEHSTKVFEKTDTEDLF